MKLYERHGERIAECAADGPKIATDRDAAALIGDALGQRASTVVLPVVRLDDAFFQLRTRLAGEIVQKFANYRLRLAIVGDIAKHVEASTALRDFVHEANKGDQLWFLADSEAFAVRLARARGA